ncbi:hypothetical protein CE91St58_68620 [Lachnospiraceae bacterium]|nr:hypothetical protein CE91St58_68620 [Lachnospiraceae bacterium]
MKMRPIRRGSPTCRIGCPGLIGMSGISAPADRISVRGRAAFCFFRETNASQRGHRTGPAAFHSIEQILIPYSSPIPGSPRNPDTTILSGPIPTCQENP